MVPQDCALSIKLLHNASCNKAQHSISSQMTRNTQHSHFMISRVNTQVEHYSVHEIPNLVTHLHPTCNVWKLADVTHRQVLNIQKPKCSSIFPSIDPFTFHHHLPKFSVALSWESHCPSVSPWRHAKRLGVLLIMWSTLKMADQGQTVAECDVSTQGLNQD